MNSRVMDAAQALMLRLTLWFALGVGVEWLTVVLQVFGDRPVIPVAFFTCVNVLASGAAVPLVLVGLAIQVRTKRVLWRILGATACAVLAMFGAFELWLVVL